MVEVNCEVSIMKHSIHKIFEVDGLMHNGPYGDDNAVLRDNSEDEGFEIVRVDQTPYNYPSTTLTIKVTDVRF